MTSIPAQRPGSSPEPQPTLPPEVDEYLERLCEVSHNAYEVAAVEAGWDTNPRSRRPWTEVPEANKTTMRAAMDAVRREILRTVYDEIHAECRWQEQQRKATSDVMMRIGRRDTIKRLTSVWDSIKARTGMIRP